ncbi:uncharacterized protein METZ01_LOCUS262178, partial [marine metagenome]
VASIVFCIVFATSLTVTVLSNSIQDNAEDLTAAVIAKMATVAVYGLNPQSEPG